jgi:hypothetical protein
LLLRIIKWSSTSSISCSCSWMHSYRWWTSCCWDCWRINIKTRILFFPFGSSILKPFWSDKKYIRRVKRSILPNFNLCFCQW